MTANVSRSEQIDFLLRRRFGTLAPPPVQTLGQSRTDAAMREASYRRSLAITAQHDPRPAIEAARAEYEALSVDALQKLVEEAKAEDTRKAESRAEKIRTERERRWPHWAKKDLWSEAEFAALCSGLIPDETGMSADPINGVLPEGQAAAISRACNDIRRGTLSGTLAFVPGDDADTAARMYGTARHYVPAIAVEWAATRFVSFPQSLLDAVRKHAPTDVARWPWGDYETEWLRLLANTHRQWWSSYDPDDRTTAPKSKDVAGWLSKQRVNGKPVSPTVAKVIAQILRADGLPNKTA